MSQIITLWHKVWQQEEEMEISAWGENTNGNLSSQHCLIKLVDFYCSYIMVISHSVINQVRRSKHLKLTDMRGHVGSFKPYNCTKLYFKPVFVSLLRKLSNKNSFLYKLIFKCRLMTQDQPVASWGINRAALSFLVKRSHHVAKWSYCRFTYYCIFVFSTRAEFVPLSAMNVFILVL